MRNLSIDQIPSHLRGEPLEPLISVDLQLYAACPKCHEETRLSTMLLEKKDVKAKLAAPCFNCGAKPLKLTKHGGHLKLHCLDCEHEFEADAMPWEDVVCVKCRSARLDLVDASVVPPFKPHVNVDRTDFLMSKSAHIGGSLGLDTLDSQTLETPWGRSGELDQTRLRAELQYAEQLPEAHAYLLPVISFCATLQSSAGYETDQDFWAIGVLQANLQQQYFKATRHLPDGLQAIQQFEMLAKAAPDEVNGALMRHSAAMAVFSALILLGEDMLAALLERPDIRHEAIAGAEEALRVLDAERARTPDDKGLLFQIAKVQWIVGDLLRVGHTTDDERRRAIGALTKALGDPTLARGRGFAVRQSRAETIMALRDATDDELKQAVEDLGEAMRAEQNDAAFDNQYLAYFAAGRLALRSNDWQQALPLLQAAATRALALVTALGDEQELLVQAEKAVQVLDATAVLYANLGWVDEALALTEVLRAVTMRRYVMNAGDRRAVADEAKARWAERLMPAAVRSAMPIAGPSLQDLDDYLAQDPIGPVVKRVLGDLSAGRAALVSLTRSDNKVMALVCTLKSADEWVNETRTWIVEDATIDALEGGAEIEANEERDEALAKLGAAGYAALLRPVEDLLAKHDVGQLLLSVPGGLSGLPFEAFSDGAGDHVLRIGTREASCVLIPSLRLASDLLQRRQKIGPRAPGALRLLVVGYHGDDLPDAGKELEALRAVWGTRLTALDGAITKHDVLETLRSDFDVIHIVGHATHNAVQPGESAMYLDADAERDTSRVTADDLLSLDPFPRAPVVILSACSSAVTADTRSNAYHGLAGALLRRGACGVIGSRWDVYDEAAAALMSELHGRLAGGAAPQQALVGAQATLRTQGRGIEDWAAFEYIGIP